MSIRHIVATIGPASESEQNLRKILPHVAIARMNMSHGTHAEHQAKIENVRKLDHEVEVLVDLQGPKIRVGKFPGGPVQFLAGDRTHLVYDPSNITNCDRMHLYVSVPHLVSDMKAGDIIHFNDGYISAKVIEKQSAERLLIEMLNNGTLSNNKGVNSSTASLSISPLTDKDLIDLEFGVAMKAEYIALSFVRSAEDVIDLRTRLNKLGSKAKIVVKIERHEAIKNLDGIVKESDVVMIARGDLGVETELSDLPRLQLLILETSKKYGKKCIWATQVLESMISVPRPTRAELTDIYTAISQGADYTMLSAESASGQFPIESVQFMAMMWTKYAK
jgi:pyruvate kinase